LGLGLVAGCVAKCPKMSHLLLLLPINKHNKALFLVEKMLAKRSISQFMATIEAQHKTSQNNHSITQQRK
jgi:hypothetical protein